MRTLIDIGESDIRALDDLAKSRQASRAALIRQAVAEYLGRHRQTAGQGAFGLWGNGGEDGLAYQERVRQEW